MCKIMLVTGPARSGKSEWAESLARQTGKEVFYLATAQTDAQDIEWLARIEKHAERRPAEWQTLLVPVELAAKIRECDRANYCLLVDSLGTWVANCLDFERETWQQTTIELLESLTQTAATVILVAEETGWGVVPAYPMGRTFRDRLGQLVRHLGAIANPVYLVTGGHILNLSTLGVPFKSEG